VRNKPLKVFCLKATLYKGLFEYHEVHFIKYLLYPLFILFCNSAFSQESYVGAFIGINSTRLTEQPPVGREQMRRQGIRLGITYDIDLYDRISLGSGLIYDQRGFIDFQPLPGVCSVGGCFLVDGRKTTRIFTDYLMVPIKFRYTVGNQLQAFIGFGLFGSMRLRAQSILEEIDASGRPFGINTDISNDVKLFDFGGSLESGLSYSLSADLEVFSALSYQQSFSLVSDISLGGEDQERHKGWNLSVGVRKKL